MGGSQGRTTTPEAAKLGPFPRGVMRITGKSRVQVERNYAAVVAILKDGKGRRTPLLAACREDLPPRGRALFIGAALVDLILRVHEPDSQGRCFGIAGALELRAPPDDGHEGVRPTTLPDRLAGHAIERRQGSPPKRQGISRSMAGCRPTRSRRVRCGSTNRSSGAIPHQRRTASFRSSSRLGRRPGRRPPSWHRTQAIRVPPSGPH
jgi:hypothetical protein